MGVAGQYCESNRKTGGLAGSMNFCDDGAPVRKASHRVEETGMQNELGSSRDPAAFPTEAVSYTHLYARFADDMVILIDAERRSDWLVKAIDKRLREE